MRNVSFEPLTKDHEFDRTARRREALAGHRIASLTRPQAPTIIRSWGHPGTGASKTARYGSKFRRMPALAKRQGDAPASFPARLAPADWLMYPVRPPDTSAIRKQHMPRSGRISGKGLAKGAGGKGCEWTGLVKGKGPTQRAKRSR